MTTRSLDADARADHAATRSAALGKGVDVIGHDDRRVPDQARHEGEQPTRWIAVSSRTRSRGPSVAVRCRRPERSRRLLRRGVETPQGPVRSRPETQGCQVVVARRVVDMVGDGEQRVEVVHAGDLGQQTLRDRTAAASGRRCPVDLQPSRRWASRTAGRGEQQRGSCPHPEPPRTTTIAPRGCRGRHRHAHGASAIGAAEVSSQDGRLGRPAPKPLARAEPAVQALTLDVEDRKAPVQPRRGATRRGTEQPHHRRDERHPDGKGVDEDPTARPSDRLDVRPRRAGRRRRRPRPLTTAAA